MCRTLRYLRNGSCSAHRAIAVQVITKSGWFAARPSGTEDIYKICAESFRGEDHLGHIVEEAQAMVDGALGVKRKP